MVYYIGLRLPSRNRVWRVGCDGRIRGLSPSRRSPQFPSDAWEWGYGGSGPADLAFALCQDVTQDAELAREVFQAVKWALISRLPRDWWILTDVQIADCIDAAGQDALAERHGVAVNLPVVAVSPILGGVIVDESERIDLSGPASGVSELGSDRMLTKEGEGEVIDLDL